jgi:hypothetical protein
VGGRVEPHECNFETTQRTASAVLYAYTAVTPNTLCDLKFAPKR